MRLGLFDILIMAGFGLWFLFPIGIYISTRRLYEDTDQADQFVKTHSELIGSEGLWEERENDWETDELELEAEKVLSFEQTKNDHNDHIDRAA